MNYGCILKNERRASNQIVYEYECDCVKWGAAEPGADRESDGLAVTGLSNQGKAWLFFKNLLVKIEGGRYSSLILKHLKNN